jgi:hypothetical protein
MWSLISIIMRPAQRYDDFELVKFKKPAKLLSSLPVSHHLGHSPGTSLYHLVPKHLWATWPMA